MTNAQVHSNTLLAAVTATGAGNWFYGPDRSSFSVTIDTSGITSGGTLKMEGLDSGNRTVLLEQITLNTAGAATIRKHYPGFLQAIRANLSARTDGTYSVYVDAPLAPAGTR